MLHVLMATVSVRVVPRSARTWVEDDGAGGFVIHVRAAPEAGRATVEAGRALADHLGVPPRSVRLRHGARSRRKLFEVAD
jgi:uncharacterized protein YggU (UPF0235/DUF167 family)